VPGIFVDYLIPDAQHGMTFSIYNDPALSGESRKSESEFPPFPYSVRKTIARRAAMELRPGAVINVGFGMPDGVMKVAREQGLADLVVPTIEQGPIGGIPAEGLEFGAANNATAIISTGEMFSFYHGRAVDITFLGFAEIDRLGNVNVSRMPHALVGVGGFIDISQKARKVVFCGTLSVKGKKPKLVENVLQVSFSGSRGRSGDQEVLYVTEAAVFRLTPDGVRLEEIAPDLDLERDVLPQLGFRPLISDQLRRMPRELFEHDRLPDHLFAGFAAKARV
jgi:propionate CoA-transferase